MKGGTTSDVVVVGAGVVGCAVAWSLASEGLSVRVLDAATPGSGATAAAMGHVVVMDDSPTQLAFTAWSRGLFADLADELPADCELLRGGTLWVARGEEGIASVETKGARLRAAGVRCEVLDGRAVAEAEPLLGPGMAGALRVPDDLIVYPPALAAWFLERARERGAVYQGGVRVESLERGAAVADGSRWEAGIVVNAAGIGAPALSSGLPITPRRGHLSITDRYPGSCTHQLVELGYLDSAHGADGESVAFNLQPRGNGQLLVGSSREPGVGAPGIRWSLLAKMLARAKAFIPALGEMNVIRSWTGVRPATPDGLPLVGPSPTRTGEWIAAGHEGLGITTALGSAHLLTDLILERESVMEPEPFAPARSARRPTDPIPDPVSLDQGNAG